MTYWENKIIEVFRNKYFNSKSGIETAFLRASIEKIFPAFENASPDEKSSFLEDAEKLEQIGLVKLKWQKFAKRQTLISITCIDTELLFNYFGAQSPKALIQEIKDYVLHYNNELLFFIADNITALDVEHGINIKTIGDFYKLLLWLNNEDNEKNVTTRGLSIKLYNDSKHLEHITSLFANIIKKAETANIQIKGLSNIDRAFPETLISGKLTFLFNDGTSLSNFSGNVIGLPYETTQNIKSISCIETEPDISEASVLTVENKETFHVLARRNKYTCVLYVGGFPNRAVADIIKLLGGSNFNFYHAGDIDPDGFLILQNIIDLCKQKVVPVNMDSAAFLKYKPFARDLNTQMIARAKLINDDTLSIPGVKDVLQLIEESGLGIEQEIVEYD